jgi:hypothetical protein
MEGAQTRREMKRNGLSVTLMHVHFVRTAQTSDFYRLHLGRPIKFGPRLLSYGLGAVKDSGTSLHEVIPLYN